MSRMQEKKHVQMEKKAWTVLYLMACALHGEKPDNSQFTEINLNEIYQISKFHGIEAMIFMALEKTEILADAEPSLVQSWKEAKEKAIRKNMLFDMERQQIQEELEQAGIWYMPLKGVILQNLYPKYGMRQMVDNDILYDASRQKEVAALMKKRGYARGDTKKTGHDIGYRKEPVYNFEMHTMLIEPIESPRWHAYYQGVEDKLLSDEHSHYGRKFSKEDFYLYLTAHTCKHYSGSGIGLRALADTYIYIRKKGELLDWDYLKRELENLGIQEFEERLRALSFKLFENPENLWNLTLTSEEEAMLSYFTESGVHGTLENHVEKVLSEFQLEENNMGLSGKLRYIRKRLFPDMDWYRKRAPFFAKFWVLIPFFLIYRVIRHLLFYRKWLRTELRILRGLGKK
ncbi:MAG: nucleotidyltransferase family protein [Lachnospiraceae bacterium]|jgi:hypothetical protein|nr:nucleotidyltransferase family protein [Lachnospiraceae bacterium]